MAGITYLELSAGHAVPSHSLSLIRDLGERTAGVDRERLIVSLVVEVHQEERDVVLPRDSAVCRQVNLRVQVTVAVALVRHQELARVGSIVHWKSADVAETSEKRSESEILIEIGTRQFRRINPTRRSDTIRGPAHQLLRPLLHRECIVFRRFSR